MIQHLTPAETKYLRILAKKHILLPTKHKKPLVEDWNNYYAETKSPEQLLALNNEYSLRTGKLIGGGYHFIALDLDDLWAKERIQDTRYIQTAKGIHRYLLIKELPKSCFLVNQTGERIGELLHSRGRFVVSIGSIHAKGTRYTLKGRVNEKWCLKFEKLTQLQTFLTERKIFTTPWGKTGIENIRDLELFHPKPTLTYQQKKQQLEEQTQKSKQKLHIRYLCLIIFPQELTKIKEHLQNQKHLEKLQNYRQRKLSKKHLIPT